jgi:hypothetical protein
MGEEREIRVRFRWFLDLGRMSHGINSCQMSGVARHSTVRAAGCHLMAFILSGVTTGVKQVLLIPENCSF